MADSSDISGLIKNIYTFANILNQASTEAAQKWNQQSITNAFNWAKYCQKVFVQTKGKAWEDDLNQQVKRLTLHLTPPLCLMLDLDDLEHASQLLLMVLMRNSYISSHLLHDAFSHEAKDSEQFILICRTQTEDANSVNVANEILRMLLFPSRDTSHESLIAQATVLLKSLLYLCQDCKSSERLERYLNSLLQRMSGMKFGQGSIVALLVSGIELITTDQEERAVRQIHNIVLKWLTNRPQLDVNDIPLSLLKEASEYHDEFLQLYLNILTKWTNQMQRVYQEAGLTNQMQRNCEGEGPVSLYKWRNKSSQSTLGFDELCAHFSSLLKSPPHVKQAVISLLKKGEGRNHFNIYKDITRSISHAKKS